MARSGLASMPIELLVHIIATYLPTKDLGALRLTSRYFEKTLFDTFAKEFFTKKQFMLTTPSLQALVDISKHAALSKFVKHVIIGLEQYDAHGHDLLSETSPTHAETYRASWADQVKLTTNGRDRELLAHAFRNLPNLRTLGIRDYSANGRAREGDAKWHSYGAPTIFAAMGVPLTCSAPNPSFDFATKVYELLLLALADANASVPSIEVILRKRGAGLGDFGFYLPPDLVPKLEPVLDGLQTLLLTINLKLKSHHFTYIPLPMPGPPPDTRVYLTEFLTHTKNLKHLRLNFQHGCPDAPAELLQSICKPTDSAMLPCLENLDFGMMATTPALVLQVIAKFAPTLRSVGFWKVSLMYTRSASHSNDNLPNTWRNFLQHTLNIENLHLTGMMLGCIDQKNDVGSSVAVHFSSRTEEESIADSEPDHLEKSRECKGDMKAFLPQLISNLRVQWPKPQVVPEIELDGDEDEDEDMAGEEETEADEEE
ncbi:hypothetical protein K505DRAFT_328677 [Melanomma pulvis-pyrius CBS 109.77]|uniref:F-box domain-containing protein n=1 Tax=Melanomma pulvis-pyrius CBS 109.77 TaxID=1314802 RepID=A0A6A6WXG2_9PLEO|nr:hypothetical protein K505DRAFT_328677 [Melanomma pulvis-pyrius CBS 109.77]